MNAGGRAPGEEYRCDVIILGALGMSMANLVLEPGLRGQVRTQSWFGARSGQTHVVGIVGIGSPGVSHGLIFGCDLDTEVIKRILVRLDTEAERDRSDTYNETGPPAREQAAQLFAVRPSGVAQGPKRDRIPSGYFCGCLWE
jgi:hypothetical protein